MPVQVLPITELFVQLKANVNDVSSLLGTVLGAELTTLNNILNHICVDWHERPDTQRRNPIIQQLALRLDRNICERTHLGTPPR